MGTAVLIYNNIIYISPFPYLFKTNAQPLKYYNILYSGHYDTT